MKKTKDAVKRELKGQWELACNGYLCELLNMWKLDSYYGYWIGDEIGSVYDYGGSFTISMDDIIYCVEHDVTEKQYMEWQDYLCDAAEFGFDTPNLKSWMMGCPRTAQEVFEKLRKMKTELNEAIKAEKEKF